MENEDQNLGNQAPGGALSIYGQADAAMDDFPVLKAFQQYIDAEQSKSRKRMILLCMFFGALMTILVAVFVFMLAQMNRDKQHVNDQLIEFLMKERDRVPQATVQQAVAPSAANPAQDAALKAMTETLTSLQKQIAEQRKADEEAAATAPTKAELEFQRKAELEAAKLRRAQEKLESEKRALADEKERLRQAEVERQRRRLYPEYYQKQEGAQAPSPATSAQPQTPSPQPSARPKRDLSDKDIEDILREVDSLKAEDDEFELEKEKRRKERAKLKAQAKATKAKDKAKTKSKSKNGDSNEPDDEETSADKPIEYFTETEYALPVNVNNKDSSWSIPLD